MIFVIKKGLFVIIERSDVFLNYISITVLRVALSTYLIDNQQQLLFCKDKEIIHVNSLLHSIT